jgi:signal transduction histidine kinase
MDEPKSIPLDLCERLHSGPLQDLAAAKFTLSLISKTGFASLEDVNEVTRLVDSATAALRAVIAGRTESAHGACLNTELHNLCAAFEGDSGITCRTALEVDPLILDPELADALYRAVRELLTNVRKHAKAAKILVKSGWRSDGDLELSVVDDGIGMEPNVLKERRFAGYGGFGLWNIDRRLAMFGGYLDIRIESGTHAIMVLPSTLTK